MGKVLDLHGGFSPELLSSVTKDQPLSVLVPWSGGVSTAAHRFPLPHDGTQVSQNRGPRGINLRCRAQKSESSN